MIEIIGKTRVIILACLFVANAFLSAAMYFFLMPETSNATRKLSGINSTNSTIQADLDNIRVEFEQLETQKQQFEDLQTQGFFDKQQRRQVESILQDIQARSGVVAATASIGAAEIVVDEDATKGKHALLQSPIEIKIEAIEDIEVYEYISILKETFPGYVKINGVTMGRRGEIDGVTLRAIATGQSPKLIFADISFMWTTLVPSDFKIGETP